MTIVVVAALACGVEVGTDLLAGGSDGGIRLQILVQDALMGSAELTSRLDGACIIEPVRHIEAQVGSSLDDSGVIGGSGDGLAGRLVVIVVDPIAHPAVVQILIVRVQTQIQCIACRVVLRGPCCERVFVGCPFVVCRLRHVLTHGHVHAAECPLIPVVSTSVRHAASIDEACISRVCDDGLGLGVRLDPEVAPDSVICSVVLAWIGYIRACFARIALGSALSHSTVSGVLGWIGVIDAVLLMRKLGGRKQQPSAIALPQPGDIVPVGKRDAPGIHSQMPT